MSDPAPTAGISSAAERSPGSDSAAVQPKLWQLVTAAFVIQLLFFLMVIAPAVYAPKVAPELGIGPQWVGVLFAVSGFAGLALGPANGALYARFGMIRVLQVAALILAVGELISVTGIPWVLLLAGVLVGAVQGPAGPACTYLVSTNAPPAKIGLLTSLQQAGAPMGMALAGGVIPLLILLMGWRWSLVVLAVPCVILALMLEGLRRPIDARIRTGATPRLRDVIQPLKMVLALPALRRLCAFAVALIMLHQGFVSFLIIYLTEELHLDLVAAGRIMAAAQCAAIAARLIWGTLGDRTRNPYLILAIAALGSALSNLGLVLYPAGSVMWPVVALSLLLGATSAGWQGLFFAVNARSVPPDKVVSALSGVAFFMFVGGGLSPMLIAAVISATGSYRVAYGMIAVVGACTGILLFRQRHRNK
jgi:MFS family permease